MTHVLILCVSNDPCPNLVPNLVHFSHSWPPNGINVFLSLIALCMLLSHVTLMYWYRQVRSHFLDLQLLKDVWLVCCYCWSPFTQYVSLWITPSLTPLIFPIRVTWSPSFALWYITTLSPYSCFAFVPISTSTRTWRDRNQPRSPTPLTRADSVIGDYEDNDTDNDTRRVVDKDIIVVVIILHRIG